MSDNKFWAVIVTVISTSLVLLVMTMLIYHHHKTKEMSSLVASGVNPIDVMCAFRGYGEDGNRVGICTLRANKEN